MSKPIRNRDWHCPDDHTLDIGYANLGVLMDIRSELQQLNALLHCANFQRISRKLDRISANTSKRKRPRRAVNGDEKHA